MVPDLFSWFDRLTGPQTVALLLAVLGMIVAIIGLIHLLRNADRYIPDAADLTHRADHEAPPESSHRLWALYLIAAAAAMISLDDLQESHQIANAADVRRARVLDEIIADTCPAPQAGDTDIVLLTYSTSADLHTSGGHHLNCNRYVERGYVAATRQRRAGQ